MASRRLGRLRKHVETSATEGDRSRGYDGPHRELQFTHATTLRAPLKQLDQDLHSRMWSSVAISILRSLMASGVAFSQDNGVVLSVSIVSVGRCLQGLLLQIPQGQMSRRPEPAPATGKAIDEQGKSGISCLLALVSDGSTATVPDARSTKPGDSFSAATSSMPVPFTH